MNLVIFSPCTHPVLDCCSLSGFRKTCLHVYLLGWTKPTCWLTPVRTKSPITRTHDLSLWRGSDLLTRSMNKTKSTHSVINLHTLSLPLPPSRCKVDPGCSSEDGVRWMWADAPWHQATLPSGGEHCSFLVRWMLIQLLPLWSTRCKVLQTLRVSHYAEPWCYPDWQRYEKKSQRQKKCRSSLFGWLWNRLRCCSGEAEQRIGQGNHPQESCGDSYLRRDSKCKDRATPSQAATVPSARPVDSRNGEEEKPGVGTKKADKLTAVQRPPEDMQFSWGYLGRRTFCSVSFGFPPRFLSKVCGDISS